MTEIMLDRPIYTKKLKSLQGNTELVKIITGVRRCGKSKLLSYFQTKLLVENNKTININLEDVLQTREIGLTYNDKGFLVGYEKLLDFILARLIPNAINYLFIDEIQMLENWQRVISTLKLKGKIDIYLTGSNAYMFSSDLANSLGGRYMEIKMLPYSFKEYYTVHQYNIHNSTKNPNKPFNDIGLKNLYKKYISESGFPQTTTFSGNKQLMNDYLMDTVYLNTIQKDIVQRFNISNVSKLDALTRFLFDNIGNKTSPKGIEKSLKNTTQSISAMTIDNYIKGLLDSYLLYKCDSYDIKGKQILTNVNSKYYAVDAGLRNVLLGYEDTDMGRVLENIVYLELLRRGYRVYTGRISSRKNIEVDFVAQKAGEEVEYYQVALYALSSQETLERELASLQAIDDNYPKYLLTMDDGSGNIRGIKRLNVLEWLFNNE